MKKVGKKIGAAILAMVLIIAMAVPVSAIVEPGPNGFAIYIYGWAGHSGSSAILKGHGINNNITVGTNNGEAGNHVWYVVPNGNGYLIKDGTQSYCVNIHRVKQYGTYYPCTGYYYENSTGGRDQRVQLVQYNGYTVIRVQNPLVGGNWYMMADYSQPVASSDVIWYSDSTAMKAHWY